MKTELTTLCYLEKDGKYLMLHRDSKENDLNKDKWIGVGGHFEDGESPEECIRRETKEETGLDLISLRYRGIITFVSGDKITEYMSLFTSNKFTGRQIHCNEGTLEWINISDIGKLNVCEGDRIFLRLLIEKDEFFSLKLTYDENDKLISAILNGNTNLK